MKAVRNRIVKTVKEVRFSQLSDNQKQEAVSKFNPTPMDIKLEKFGLSESGSLTWMTANQVATP